MIEINVIHECMSNYRHEIREAPFTPCTRLDIHQEQVGNECDPNLCANGIPTIAKEIAQLEVLLQLLEAIAQIVVTLQFSFWALFLHLNEQISL